MLGAPAEEKLGPEKPEAPAQLTELEKAKAEVARMQAIAKAEQQVKKQACGAPPLCIGTLAAELRNSLLLSSGTRRWLVATVVGIICRPRS